MPRFRTLPILVLLIFLNGAAGFMAASGIADNLGVAPQPGGSGQIEEMNNDMKSFGSSTTDGEGFTGRVGGALSYVIDAFSVLFAAPTMIANAGVPTYAVTFAFAPLYLLVGLDLISLFLGG
ncbi:MAG: hypothetical protein SV253_08185 [Halobacteria archaeon]|nr:hypothetical protein [Halobacteria archaeon]